MRTDFTLPVHFLPEPGGIELKDWKQNINSLPKALDMGLENSLHPRCLHDVMARAERLSTDMDVAIARNALGGKLFTFLTSGVAIATSTALTAMTKAGIPALLANAVITIIAAKDVYDALQDLRAKKQSAPTEEFGADSIANGVYNTARNCGVIERDAQRLATVASPIIRGITTAVATLLSTFLPVAAPKILQDTAKFVAIGKVVMDQMVSALATNSALISIDKKPIDAELARTKVLDQTIPALFDKMNSRRP